MHLVLLLLIQVSLSWSQTTGTVADLSARRGEFLPILVNDDIQELNRVFFTEHTKNVRDLKRAKYYLINGELRLASVFLMNLAYANTKLRPIIYRYLAMLNFVEGDYKKSYDFLRRKELDMPPHFGKVCTLRVLTQIILSVTHNLEDQWARCRTESFGHFSFSNLWWMQTLIDLKLRPYQGVTKRPFKTMRLEGLSTDELKIFLKLAIYLNQENIILSELQTLRVDHLQDNEVRELVGHIYFRTGSLSHSYRYIEDLKSPNSENIKGNLYILRKKYELAYAQFKLALEQKQNSQNAMERLLPLAWLLGDWAGGANYAERVLTSPQTYINKMALAAAFHVQKGSFTEARSILDTITQKSRRGSEIDVTQLHSFSALMQNLPLEAKKFAALSCEQYDLTNCWMLFQLGTWDAFSVLIRRDDKIAHKREWEKLTKEDINNPLKETVYVNQLDIEELDDKSITLIPKETK